MLRAILKGSALFAIGRIPGGCALYRRVTRELLGTQASHATKLRRVTPGYVEVWKRIGVELEGAALWIHEPGWTPFWPAMVPMLTGRGGVFTNHEATMLERYIAQAVDAVVTTEVECSESRRVSASSLRWAHSVSEILEATSGALYEDVRPTGLPLSDESVDLCHSGGTLEHYPPALLRAFLAESFRVLKRGGIASHVFDHRDHLHHADRRYPFLWHYTMPDAVHRLFCGHSLLYHNRLLPTQVARMFAEAGFELLSVRRMIYPSREYVDSEEQSLAGVPGAPRRLLSRRFRDTSEADLRTAAAHYLARKPP